MSNNKLALMAMLESIEKIQRFTSDLSSWEDLKNDEETFDACLMNFVIIGESVLRLDVQFIETNNQIEWNKIRGFRNFDCTRLFWNRYRGSLGYYSKQNP
jgi:uncharacterized protein with HEPN domain